MSRFSAHIVCIAFLIFLGQPSFAQELAGRYALEAEGAEITLSLEKGAKGVYTGSLEGNGVAFRLRGVLQDGVLSGNVGEPSDGIVFRAEWQGDRLTLTMAETDEDGNPMPETARVLVFKRLADQPEVAADTTAADTLRVVINGRALTPEKIAEIEKRYGVRPRPGNYWYDKTSGLYGVVGYPAYGFMYPGHDFGPLSRGASNGDTGVLVNGRELPKSEWAVWSYILGYWIQPGSYWLDHAGNAGYEGSPIPVVNLFAAAQQNAYRGRGAGGDNFWSRRFSAGNFDAGNQRGYVSVPGYGPVGYGF